jgi:hypothetical protein
MGSVGPAARFRKPAGAWRVDQNGYVFRKVVGSYTRRDDGSYDGGTKEFQHRVVMEQIIGRRLHPFENVHHVNGIRDDNRPENLELWVTSQPSGQRPIDLARWVLDVYPDLIAAEQAERAREIA